MGLFDSLRGFAAKTFGAVSKDTAEVDRLSEAIRTCRELDVDLIEFHTSAPSCPECAKYAGRVFSISGTHPVFPPIPENLPSMTLYHQLQCLSFYPYHWGIDPAEDRQKVALSKQSYIDLRTQEERERYEAWAAQMADLRAEEARKKAARDEYNWLVEHLPDLCPKALGSYSRMRNTRSAGFLKLAEEAAKLGRELGADPDPD